VVVRGLEFGVGGLVTFEAWEYSVGKCSRRCGQGDIAAEDAIGWMVQLECVPNTRRQRLGS
jgi:hypothetical protein